MATFKTAAVPYTTGNTVYAQVRNSVGQYLDPTTWEWGSLAAATWATFSKACVEEPAGTGYYYAVLDETAFTEGAEYLIYYYRQDGVDPAVGDVSVYLDEFTYAEPGSVPGAATHIVTLLEAKNALRLHSTAEDDDVILYRNAAESYIEQECGIKIGETEDIVEYCEGGGHNLYPTSLPIVEVDSIVDTENDETEDDDDYKVRDRTMIWNDAGRWADNGDPGRWKVTYTGGYGTTIDIPNGLKSIALAMIERAWDNRGGLNSLSGGGVSQAWQDWTMSDFSHMLKRFRLRGYSV